MFVRAKKRGDRTYLMIVENERVNGKVKQRVLHSLGRLDVLQETGQLDGLLLSAQRFSEKLAVLGAHERGESITTRTTRIGPALVLERLWRVLKLDQVLGRLLADRRFEFAVERAVFLTVLHRLFASGSDRAAEKWKDDYAIRGVRGLALHHLYRAMAWLGEPLPEDQQWGATPFTPRCVKDRIEEDLFAARRSAEGGFTGLDIVFFDKCAVTIRGHVFCSFLALVLRKELQDRLEAKGWHLEWADIIRDLDNLLELEVRVSGKGYLIRNEIKGSAGQVAQAAGVALPPSIRPC